MLSGIPATLASISNCFAQAMAGGVQSCAENGTNLGNEVSATGDCVLMNFLDRRLLFALCSTDG